MPSIRPILCVALASSLAACSMLGDSQTPAPEQVQKTAPVTSEPVLYARDGSIVTPAGAGSGSSLPRRDVQGADGSRTKILELYQRVVEERDRLSMELIARDAELAQLRRTLEEATTETAAMAAQVQAAQQAAADLQTQNLDLAGRLTTAQIRRLEAEKKWLESALAQAPKPLAALQADGQARAKSEPAATDTRPTEKP